MTPHKRLARNEFHATELKNAHRVLLSCPRQGMVIVVPEGKPEDPDAAGGVL